MESNDTAAIAREPQNTHPAYGETDPDPTDSIAAGNYLPNGSNEETAQLVKSALRDSLLKDDLAIMDSSQRKFVIHDVDLNADGIPETFVALANVNACGSQGCTVYLLDNEATLKSVFLVSDFPIIVMNNTSRGWNDLLVNYRGITYRLKYDGKSYPREMESKLEYTQELPNELPLVFDFKHANYPWFHF